MKRRDFIKLTAGAGAAVAMPAVARAQSDYPNKPVRIITHSAAGGSPDALLRLVADKLSQMWGRQVLVLNQPGAGGSVAARAAAQADPDGYTLYMPASSAFVALAGAQPNLPLELPRDFLPVGFVALQPFFLWVGSQVPAKTLPEFIALAKEKPGQLAYAATGRGTLSHLTGEGLQLHANIQLQLVPYQGGTAQALNDVIAGRIPMVIDAYPPLVGAMQSGHVRPLAVGSEKRFPAFPNVATMQETLPGFRSSGWLALVAPRGTPDAIVRKLSADLRTAVLDPTTRQKLETTGNLPNPMTPQELLTFIQSEQKMWKPVVEAIARKPS